MYVCACFFPRLFIVHLLYLFVVQNFCIYMLCCVYVIKWYTECKIVFENYHNILYVIKLTNHNFDRFWVNKCITLGHRACILQSWNVLFVFASSTIKRYQLDWLVIRIRVTVELKIPTKNKSSNNEQIGECQFLWCTIITFTNYFPLDLISKYKTIFAAINVRVMCVLNLVKIQNHKFHGEKHTYMWTHLRTFSTFQFQSFWFVFDFTQIGIVVLMIIACASAKPAIVSVGPAIAYSAPLVAAAPAPAALPFVTATSSQVVRSNVLYTYAYISGPD